jgi:hypothetical protein
MINARWLFRRIENAQTAAMNIALAENAKSNAAKYEQLDPRHEHSIAYDDRGEKFDRLDKLQDRCDRRYGRVFVGHNGAQSYYSARAFRGSLIC